MKKLLFALFILAFIVGCGSTQDKPSQDESGEKTDTPELISLKGQYGSFDYLLADDIGYLMFSFGQSTENDLIVTLSVKNTGKSTYYPSVDTFALSDDGQMIIDYNPDRVAIEPGTTGQIDLKFSLDKIENGDKTLVIITDKYHISISFTLNIES